MPLALRRGAGAAAPAAPLAAARGPLPACRYALPQSIYKLPQTDPHIPPTPQAPEVWPLYAAQHRAASQAMVSLLQAAPAPAPKPVAASPAKPAAPKAEPGSPRCVLRTPGRTGGLTRTPSTGSSADSLADSVMSHPLVAEAAPKTAAAPARRGRPGFAANLVKAIVPLAAVGVAAAAGMQHRTRRPSPASRKAQASRFPEVGTGSCCAAMLCCCVAPCLDVLCMSRAAVTWHLPASMKQQAC